MRKEISLCFQVSFFSTRKYWIRVMNMKQKRGSRRSDCLRLNPETRRCPKFDATGVALYPAASHEKMGVCVVDDCVEEHIM